MNTQRLVVSIGLLALSFLSQAQTTWYPVTVPTQEKLNDIQFVDDQVGFIVGENGTFLKTSNGGSLWDQPFIQGIPNQATTNILQIEMVDAMNGFLAIEYGSNVFQTSDGGFTWSAVVNSGTNQCLPVTVHALTTDNFFIGGSDCFQGATINQVQSGNWTVKTVNYMTGNTDQYVREIDFDGSLGLAALNAEYMLRSTDTGATWDTINTNIGAGNVLTSVMIANNDTCYAGYDQNGGGFGVLFSADSGLTWQEDMNSATFYYPAYYGGTLNSNGKAYLSAVPSNTDIGVIFERVGSNWQNQGVDEPVYAMDSYGTDVTWAVGDSGFVVVNQDLSAASLFEYNEQSNLLEVYPNPVQNMLEWDCSDCVSLEMQIIDLNGNIVKKNNDNFKQSLDVSDLSSGMYILSVKSDKGLCQERFIKE